MKLVQFLYTQKQAFTVFIPEFFCEVEWSMF